MPVLLEIGREPVYGEARETILAEAAAALAEEAAEPARAREISMK